MSAPTFATRLTKIDVLSDEVSSFTFEALDGTPFAACKPGDHVDVHLPGDLQRQYSLWQWDPAGRWGSVAVKREDAGRGGSKAMHALKEGDSVTLTGPRSNFPLHDEAAHSILLAGGIGATPIHAMAAHLTAQGKPVDVYYLVRGKTHSAFEPAFEALGLGAALHCHYDDADGLFDLDAMLGAAPAGSHLYVCGPEPLLQAAIAAGEKHLPHNAIHFERFSADPTAQEGENHAFELVLQQSGKTVQVPADRSILDALAAAKIPADYSCSEGICGACITDVIEGEIDHRDSVLTDEERADGDIMCLCVSRAKGKRLVIDL